MSSGERKVRKTIVELLESEELLTELAACSTISALIRRMNASNIIRELLRERNSDPEKIKLIENYLGKAIRLEVDSAYLHPKTLEICVCVFLLGKSGSERAPQLIKQLIFDPAPKFFLCRKLAREVFARMETNSTSTVRYNKDTKQIRPSYKFFGEGTCSYPISVEPRNTSYKEFLFAS